MTRLLSILLLTLFTATVSLETYSKVLDDQSISMELKDSEGDSEEQEDEAQEETINQTDMIDSVLGQKFGNNLSSSEMHYLLVFRQLLANDILLPPPELV